MKISFNWRTHGIAILFLLLVSAAAFLPLAQQMGFYNDDWYLLYAGQTQGIEKFHDVFSIDRPARAYLVGFFYQVFGTHAVWYTLSAWFLRLLGALSLYGLTGSLWKKQTRARLLVSVFFVIYPGFLEQPNAFDYQSHLVSLSFAIFSITLTLKAMTAEKKGAAILCHSAAALTGLVYMSLMEYYIGMEVLRLALVWYLLKKTCKQWLERLWCSLLHGLPAIATALAFLVWRFFLFNNQRAATDIQGMFGGLTGSPLYQGMWLLVYLLQDMLNVTLFAWVVPAYDLAFRMRLRDILLAGSLAMAVLAVYFLLDLWMRRKPAEAETEGTPDSLWWRDALMLGAVGVAGALLPVTFGSRHVVFSDFSRFSLPGCVGAALAVMGILFGLKSDGLRRILAGVMVALALMTHFANATQYAAQWETMRSFWWQVSWRAPQIEDGVTLIANYPNVGIAEDYFVWGPANLIYRPQPQAGEVLNVWLPAAVLNSDTLLKIRMQKGEETVNRRGILLTRDFSNILVLSMPSLYSCVQMLDGGQMVLSSHEEANIMLAAPFSRLSAVLTDSAGVIPPETIFGEEPPHDWCYIYQKASLARQRGDWETVAGLGDEAEAQGLRPADGVEWMPFVQAYAYLGDEEKVQGIASIIKSDAYIHLQACQLFSADAAGMGQAFPEGQRLLLETFCD